MKTYNFSAGPAKLPEPVLEQAQRELLNWQGVGASVMEVSHRGKEFDECALQATDALRKILNVPDNYKILFLQGGARSQFAMIPMNILGDNNNVHYIESGYWSKAAADEAEKYAKVKRENITQDQAGKIALKPMSEWQIESSSSYLHYCPNETIDGVALFDAPKFKDQVVVADFSSCILSKPINVADYGLIYAGAQKNIGPSGITIVIVREDLLERKASPLLPSVFNYAIETKNGSMFNTPPTFAWYLSGLVFNWIEELGGVDAIYQRNLSKANALYNYIDQSDFYHNFVAESNRSIMNVPFKTVSETLDAAFISEAKKAHIMGIKGHRIVGGMRASIYNAMGIDEVNYLVDFMKEFERKNG